MLRAAHLPSLLRPLPSLPWPCRALASLERRITPRRAGGGLAGLAFGLDRLRLFVSLSLSLWRSRRLSLCRPSRPPVAGMAGEGVSPGAAAASGTPKTPATAGGSEESERKRQQPHSRRSSDNATGRLSMELRVRIRRMHAHGQAAAPSAHARCAGEKGDTANGREPADFFFVFLAPNAHVVVSAPAAVFRPAATDASMLELQQAPELSRHFELMAVIGTGPRGCDHGACLLCARPPWLNTRSDPPMVAQAALAQCTRRGARPIRSCAVRRALGEPGSRRKGRRGLAARFAHPCLPGWL